MKQRIFPSRRKLPRAAKEADPRDVVISNRHKKNIRVCADDGEPIETYVRRDFETGEWFAEDCGDPSGESLVSRAWVAEWLKRLDYLGFYNLLTAGRI